MNQSSTSNFSVRSIPPPDPRTSEDCLFLDVIAPQALFDARDEGYGAPVLVWIYGGGYTEGSKSEDGNPATLLARAKDNNATGIVHVAINYRLGLFGWLSGPTFQMNATANLGLYDQELALRWIQENISKFGGDPNRITVIGDSAGGGSIMHQITAYGGLKGKYASVVAKKNIPSLEELRNLTLTQLYEINYAIVGLSQYGTFTFGPTVDERFAPRLPGELILHGQYDQSLRVLVGHNADECAFLSSPFILNDTTFVALC
ncbi:MAG: hypothetical protein M1818_003910 [Claussenomyces sp. TS43310]|nr:MAG: hypothetical protein M1818_003910 [Claussenomyces sp. TS43310]